MVLLLAFITMFIDHLGMFFFPEYDLFRIIWRLSFPLFAWGIVRWYGTTRNVEKYIKRLFLLAIISQIPVFFTYGLEVFNVIFTLTFGLLALVLYDYKKLWKIFKILFLWIIFWISYYFNFEYGIFWILTILLIHIFWGQKKQIILFALLTLVFYFNKNLYQLFSIFAFVLLFYTPILKYDFKLNFYFKYLFYPVHFAILYILYLYLNIT